MMRVVRLTLTSTYTMPPSGYHAARGAAPKTIACLAPPRRCFALARVISIFVSSGEIEQKDQLRA